MNSSHDSKTTKRQGQILSETVIEQEESRGEGRAGQIIKVSPIEESSTIPESISAGDALPNVPDYTKIKLEAVPLRGLKYFTVAILLALLVYAGVEIRTTFNHAMQIHWTVAVAFGGLISIVFGAGLYLLWQVLGKDGDEQQIEELRSLAADISLQHNCGAATGLLEKMDILYHSKPQNIHWQRCKKSIPDYNDDREVLAHLDRLFLCKLDEEAQRRISKHSTQIGIAVAVSPWASMDMLLSFWRNLQMIMDVAQVYGVRPSLRNRLKLIRRVLNHMAVSAASELAISELLQDVGGQEMLSVLSARFGQGLGVGIYSAKIGISVMHVCRPIPFEKDNSPSLAHMAGQLKQRIFKQKT